jgi:hypothetical protein
MKWKEVSHRPLPARSVRGLSTSPDIPNFSLDTQSSSNPTTPGPSSPDLEATSSQPSRPSGSGRQSNASSRSTSFNLPAEERISLRPTGDLVQGEISEEEMDEESEFQLEICESQTVSNPSRHQLLPNMQSSSRHAAAITPTRRRQ